MRGAKECVTPPVLGDLACTGSQRSPFDSAQGRRAGLNSFAPPALVGRWADRIIGTRILCTEKAGKESGAFGELIGDEIGGGWAALFPGFEKDGEDNQDGSG